MIVVGVIIGIIILTLLVVVHEFGHYIVARRNGVVVEEFGIGLPPKAWGKKLKNGVLFSLNWLPIGGFCKMQGESDASRKKGDYGRASYWQKTKILFAGVAMNWLAAIVIFTILALIGMPRIIDNQFTVPSDTQNILGKVTVQQVVKDSPAEKNGIKTGYEIKSIGGETVKRSSDVSRLTKKYAGQTIKVEYVVPEGDQATNIAVQLNDKSSDKGYLGVSVGNTETLRSTWSAPIVGVVMTGQLTAETFKGLGSLAGNFFGGLAKQLSFDQSTRENGRTEVSKAGDGVTGPVGIVGVLFPQAAQSGATTLLMLAGIISLSLAVMNVLPIPALDGGRWFLTTIFKIRRKKLTQEIEEKVVSVGFLILFGLLILITIVDVVRLF